MFNYYVKIMTINCLNKKIKKANNRILQNINVNFNFKNFIKNKQIGI